MTCIDPAATYAEGYAHGSILLVAIRQGGDLAAPVQRLHADYLRMAGLAAPTSIEHAYVAGFRDAVSGNLPCPLQDIETPARRRVA